MSVIGNGQGGGNSNATKRWEGYSDYSSVSKRIERKVSSAMEAYAILQSAGSERADLNPREYMEARARILDAAMTLKTEVEREAEKVGDDADPQDEQRIYAEINHRWKNGDENVNDGYINKFHELSIRETGVPGWVFRFVEDIRRAAWELGYLKAGRTVKEEDLPPAEKQAKEMFE